MSSILNSAQRASVLIERQPKVFIREVAGGSFLKLLYLPTLPTLPQKNTNVLCYFCVLILGVVWNCGIISKLKHKHQAS